MSTLTRATDRCSTAEQRIAVQRVLEVLPNTCQPRQGDAGAVLLYWLPATVRESWHVLLAVDTDGTVTLESGPMQPGGRMSPPRGQDPLDRLLEAALEELVAHGVRV